MKYPVRIASIVEQAIYAYTRHFPWDKGKRRLLNYWGPTLAMEQPIRQTLLKVADIRMECDLRRFIQRHLYFMGEYEPEQVAFWMAYARQAKVIFDVGANVGLYSLAAAASQHDAVIHAFEPTPELVERLQTNIALNGFDHIVVNCMAVGQRSGQIYLHYSGGRDGSNEGMNYVSDAPSAAGNDVVPMVSLDDYCQRNQIDGIDLLKMDIEGNEFNALCGAEALLQRGALRCIFMELNSWAVERSGYSVSDIVEFIGDHGYRFHQVRKNELVEITDHRLLVDRDVVVLPAAQPSGADHPSGLF